MECEIIPYEKSIGLGKQIKNRFDKFYYMFKAQLSDKEVDVNMNLFIEVLLSCWEEKGGIEDYMSFIEEKAEKRG